MTQPHIDALAPAPADDLCLGFANTKCWRGSTPPVEELNGVDDLLVWAGGSGGVDRGTLARFRASRRAGAALSAAIELRELLFRVFEAVASGGVPAEADLGALNAALSAAPARTRLERRDGRHVWLLGDRAPRLETVLAPALWSAGDLLAGARSARVRQCANPRCGWLFLDDSKGGNRRWCSMSSCGNRAKAHRHYAKRRQAARGE